MPTLYYIIVMLMYYVFNDNNVARVKSKRIETSICSIINIKLSTPIFGLPMGTMTSLQHLTSIILL